MERWDLDGLDVRPRQPEILLSHRGAARAIALDLPAGERLQEHEVHEHAWLFVARGEVDVEAGGDTATGSAGTVFHFSAKERHAVHARQDSRLLLLLAPWPGEGHPGARDPA